MQLSRPTVFVLMCTYISFQCFFLIFRPCCTTNQSALKSFIGMSLISWASDGRDIFTCFTSFFFISFITYLTISQARCQAWSLLLVAWGFFRIILNCQHITTHLLWTIPAIGVYTHQFRIILKWPSYLVAVHFYQYALYIIRINLTPDPTAN